MLAGWLIGDIEQEGGRRGAAYYSGAEPFPIVILLTMFH
jgi:hypothetical protein